MLYDAGRIPGTSGGSISSKASLAFMAGIRDQELADRAARFNHTQIA